MQLHKTSQRAGIFSILSLWRTANFFTPCACGTINADMVIMLFIFHTPLLCSRSRTLLLKY